MGQNAGPTTIVSNLPELLTVMAQDKEHSAKNMTAKKQVRNLKYRVIIIIIIIVYTVIIFFLQNNIYYDPSSS